MSADLPPSTTSTRRKNPRVVEQQSSSVLSPGFTPWHRNVPSSAVDTPAPVPQPSTLQRQPPSQTTLLPPSITSPSDYSTPAINISSALSEAPVSVVGTASAASASASVSANAGASVSVISSAIVSASASTSAPTSTTTALDVDPHKYTGIPTMQDASNNITNFDMNVADINTSEHIRRLTSGNGNSPVGKGPAADSADPADDLGEGETNGAEQQVMEVNNEEAAVDDKVEKDKLKLEDKRKREEFLKEQKRLEEEDKANLDTCRRYFMFGCCGLPLLHFFTVIYFYQEWNGKTRNFHIQKYIWLCLIVGVVQLFLWIIWFLVFQVKELEQLSILKTDASVVGRFV